MPKAGSKRLLSRYLLTLGITLAWTAVAHGEVTPCPLFLDHVVLQAGKPVALWGQAAPAEKVTVSFAGQNVTATAGSDGAWKAMLTPLKVNAEPAELVFKGTNTVVVKDVLVGEVWVCSGQSNMEFQLSKAKDAQQEIANANYPLIRYFYVKNRVSNAPEKKLQGNWVVCSPANADWFSAVGYFFAREIFQRLNVPVGIVNASWGGTRVEAWMSATSIDKDPALRFVAQDWQKTLADFPASQAKYDAIEVEENRKAEEAKAQGQPYKKRWHRPPPKPDGSPHEDKPSAIYNGMVNPLLPATLAGVLWYQGESNTEQPEHYAPLFKALITGWREAFQQPNLPFYWVQLPNYNGNSSTLDWVRLRAAQAGALALPATGQAVTIDVGEPKNIHPLDKQDVGHRLALIAFRQAYGQTLVSSGPRFAEVKFAQGSAKATLTDLGGGLDLRSTSVTAFELAGDDRVFKPAEARVEGNSVVVRAAAVPSPVALRYAWRNAPEASLFNKDGLPAAPFRTDNW